MRQFNTAGPVVAEDHYHVPPLERIDLDTVLGLVRDKKYSVLHGPRQTGKTSALLALRDLLNGGGAGDFRCVYANVEDGQAMRENVAEGMRTVLAELALQASVTLGDDTLEDLWPAVLERVGPGQALRHALLRWCMADPRPLVLLIDETDALIGDTLLAVLRQLRTGYVDRPARFPHSIILCGVRDVRDYRIHSSAENRLVLGGSVFNIKSESLRLGNFSEQEIRALLAQHTAVTGRPDVGSPPPQDWLCQHSRLGSPCRAAVQWRSPWRRSGRRRRGLPVFGRHAAGPLPPVRTRERPLHRMQSVRSRLRPAVRGLVWLHGLLPSPRAGGRPTTPPA